MRQIRYSDRSQADAQNDGVNNCILMTCTACENMKVVGEYLQKELTEHEATDIASASSY